MYLFDSCYVCFNILLFRTPLYGSREAFGKQRRWGNQRSVGGMDWEREREREERRVFVALCEGLEKDF